MRWVLSLLVHKEIEISQLVSVGAGVGPGVCPQHHHASLLCLTGPFIARDYGRGGHSQYHWIINKIQDGLKKIFNCIFIVWKHF